MYKINVDQIVSIRGYMNLKADTYSYREPSTKRYFFFWKKEVPGGYQDSLDKIYGHVKTEEEIKAVHSALICKDKVVYWKPHLEIRMSNNNLRTIFFDHEEELRQWVDSIIRKTILNIRLIDV